MASTKDQVELSTNGTDFTLFPDLPKEFRDAIWKFALPEPRVVCVVPYKLDNHPKARFYYRRSITRFDHIIDVNPAPTPILHTCHEARIAALRSYQWAFTGVIKTPIYFDFERDSLLFTSRAALMTFYGHHELGHSPSLAAVRAWQSKIRNVRVEGGFFEAADQTALIRCPLLKELIIGNLEANLGCRQHGIFQEIFNIRDRLKNALKERLQTDDETTLPVLEFAFCGNVKLDLGRS